MRNRVSGVSSFSLRRLAEGDGCCEVHEGRPAPTWLPRRAPLGIFGVLLESNSRRLPIALSIESHFTLV